MLLLLVIAHILVCQFHVMVVTAIVLLIVSKPVQKVVLAEAAPVLFVIVSVDKSVRAVVVTPAKVA